MKTKKHKLLSTIFSLFIILFFRFIPAPAGLNSEGMQVIGIFSGVLILWITVGIDWPSLLCLAALSFVPSIGVGETLKNSFGNQTFAFLLFTFMCTYALSQTSIIKRIALAFVTSKIARKGPWQLTALFLLSVLVIGSVMSPTVLFFIMLPILEEIYRILELKKGDKFAAMLMIGLVTCTSLSSAMTPIAHVFPVIAMGVFEALTDVSISYASYMQFAIPAGLLIFGIMMGIFKVILKPDVSNFRAIYEEDFRNTEVAPFDLREKLIVSVFAVVIAFWILPGLVKDIFPAFTAAVNQYGTAMPPLIGVIVLAMIKVEGKSLMNINEAMTKGVSWPSMIMVASTLALGSAMTNESIGLTRYITEAIMPVTHQLSTVLLIILFITWAAIQSNLSSHMVTSQLVSSIAVPVAISTGSLNAAAIACVIGMVSAIGSAAPPSMPYVAVAGSSGWTDAMELMKYGFYNMLGTIIVAAVVAYPLADLVLKF